jgi:hypothetical protein
MTTRNSSTTPVILVTAGSAGLGAAAVRLFAQHGYRVVINYGNNEERASKLLAELPGTLKDQVTKTGSDGGEEAFVIIKADLGSRDEIRRLVQEVSVSLKSVFLFYSYIQLIIADFYFLSRYTRRLSGSVASTSCSRMAVGPESGAWTASTTTATRTSGIAPSI